ncbi:hypothetical protein QQP08_018290 [Theobroma cacao]|nr:hypothetical protein QQP08_018290 [Theobroma cacao]
MGFPCQKSGGNYTQHKGIHAKKEEKRNTYLSTLLSASVESFPWERDQKETIIMLLPWQSISGILVRAKSPEENMATHYSAKHFLVD